MFSSATPTLEVTHHRPDVMQSVRVVRSGIVLITVDLCLDIVVVKFGSDLSHDRGPIVLWRKYSKCVIGVRRCLNISAGKDGKAHLKSPQMIFGACANHDAIRIDRLIGLALTVSRTYDAKETVPGKNPHYPIVAG
jgi:hypothetical protein